ncbi:MAG: MFS transporter [Alcanivoracaceae bacterium]|nr:MFS transporter [Alcanivoracaceae bacterium]
MSAAQDSHSDRNAMQEKLYALIANEEDARVCTDIPDAACREVPGNFMRILASLVLTKLGDLVTSPKTVLAWVMGTLGASPVLSGLLVPVRESGSLLPQLVIGAWVRGHARRKQFWVLGSVLQGVAMLAMAAAVAWMDTSVAPLAIILLLVAFSLSRGLCSVAMKDVQGKCVPKSRRGRLTGLASTFSGLLTVAVSGLMMLDNVQGSRLFLAALLGLAGIIWVLAAVVFSRVTEYPGESNGGGNALREALASLSLLRTDRPFRRFVLARALLLCSALSAPFVILVAQRLDTGLGSLALFLLASSLASSLSASFWGWMADTSARDVMTRGGLMSSALVLLVAAAVLMDALDGESAWLLPLAYFILGIGHAGVRVGRKTYLVDMAGGNKRTDYVAVSNSVIGALLLLVGVISGLVASLGEAWALLLLGLMGLAGAIVTRALPQV